MYVAIQQRDNGVHAFPSGISLKVNAMSTTLKGIPRRSSHYAKRHSTKDFSNNLFKNEVTTN